MAKAQASPEFNREYFMRCCERWIKESRFYDVDEMSGCISYYPQNKPNNIQVWCTPFWEDHKGICFTIVKTANEDDELIDEVLFDEVLPFYLSYEQPFTDAMSYMRIVEDFFWSPEIQNLLRKEAVC